MEYNAFYYVQFLLMRVVVGDLDLAALLRIILGGIKLIPQF